MQSKISALKSIYDDMMEIAREQLNPEWKTGEAIVLETYPGEYCYLAIPDFQDLDVREPLEKDLLECLISWKYTRVLHCLCVISGGDLMIPSGNLCRRLVEIDSRNLNAEVFLWGGGEDILVKPLSALLPPQHSTC